MAPASCSTCHTLLCARLRRRISFLACSRSKPQIQTRYKNYQTPIHNSRLANYWDTTRPVDSQLRSATKFFATHPPRKLWTALEWRLDRQRKRKSPQNATPESPHLIPEVTFLGRSNVGKSSLLNALCQTPLLNHVSKHPGRTKMMHAWGLSASDPVTGGAGPKGEMDIRLAVLDMPGYGHGSHVDWGKEIITYLRRRKQLRRAFVLIDASHGFKRRDELMVSLLREEGISYQIVVTKVDRLIENAKKDWRSRLRQLFDELRQKLVQPPRASGVDGIGELLAVGNLEKKKTLQKRGTLIKATKDLGIPSLSWAVLVAVGLQGLEGFVTKTAHTDSIMINQTNPNATDDKRGIPTSLTGVDRTPDTLSPPLKDHDPSSASPQEFLNTTTFLPMSLADRQVENKSTPQTTTSSNPPIIRPIPHDIVDLELSSSASSPDSPFHTRNRSARPAPQPRQPPMPATPSIGVGGMAELMAVSQPKASEKRPQSRQMTMKKPKQRRRWEGRGKGQAPMMNDER